jgi:hypothetical protein
MFFDIPFMFVFVLYFCCLFYVFCFLYRFFILCSFSLFCAVSLLYLYKSIPDTATEWKPNCSKYQYLYKHVILERINK